MSVDRQEVKEKLLYIYSMGPAILGFIMGIMLIIRGSWGLYHFFALGDVSWVLGLAYGIMLAAGLFTIAIGKDDLVRTIGLYALTLGLTRTLMRYDQIMDDYSILNLLIRLPMMIVALNLMYTGVSFMGGRVIRRMSMMVTTFILIGVNMMLIMIVMMYDEDIGIEVDVPMLFIEAVMYMALIVLLDSEQIRYGSSDGKHIRHLDRIRASYRIDRDSHISSETADCLIKRDGSLWRIIDDDVVEKEMSFTVSGRSIDSTIIAQIWKGHDQMYLSVVQKEGTIVYANRMKIDIVESDGKTICFYGKDGSDFRFKIEDELI